MTNNYEAHPLDTLPIRPDYPPPGTRLITNPESVSRRETHAASMAMASVGYAPVFSPAKAEEAAAALRRAARKEATGRVAELLAQADALDQLAFEVAEERAAGARENAQLVESKDKARPLFKHLMERLRG